jgi:hypothetical protein
LTKIKTYSKESHLNHTFQRVLFKTLCFFLLLSICFVNFSSYFINLLNHDSTIISLNQQCTQHYVAKNIIDDSRFIFDRIAGGSGSLNSPTSGFLSMKIENKNFSSVTENKLHFVNLKIFIFNQVQLQQNNATIYSSSSSKMLSDGLFMLL